MLRFPVIALALVASLLLAAPAAAAGVRVVREPDGTVRLTNRRHDRSPARTVREADGTVRVVLRGGVSHTPRPDRGQYDHLFTRATEAHGVPALLLKAVVRAESGFDPAAVSVAGAQGLMQLMPGTAALLGVADPFDPAQAIDGGARYLRRMLDRFQGDLRLALAAYNAGPEAVERYGDVPPYEETQRYVRRILQWYEEDRAAATEPSDPAA